jgi:hypothetical protein
MEKSKAAHIFPSSSITMHVVAVRKSEKLSRRITKEEFHQRSSRKVSDEFIEKFFFSLHLFIAPDSV